LEFLEHLLEAEDGLGNGGHFRFMGLVVFFGNFPAILVTNACERFNLASCPVTIQLSAALQIRRLYEPLLLTRELEKESCTM
jgi:hypothetical protein